MGLFGNIFGKTIQIPQLEDEHSLMVRWFYEECGRWNPMPKDFIKYVNSLYHKYRYRQKSVPRFTDIYEDIWWDFIEIMNEEISEYVYEEYKDDPQFHNDEDYRDECYTAVEEDFYSCNNCFSQLYNWVEEAMVKLGYTFIHDEYSQNYVINPAQMYIFNIDPRIEEFMEDKRNE